MNSKGDEADLGQWVSRQPRATCLIIEVCTDLRHLDSHVAARLWWSWRFVLETKADHRTTGCGGLQNSFSWSGCSAREAFQVSA